MFSVTIFVRNFNYKSHGSGEDKRKEPKNKTEEKIDTNKQERNHYQSHEQTKTSPQI